MTRVITYGTYDLLHQGHVNILKRAKDLGDYLIVGVTSDIFDRERGKLNVKNNVLERVEAVRETGYANEIIIEDYLGQKIDDIQKYNVDIFAIGSDWEGQFDYLKEFCEVVYLPRTEGVSSTLLRAKGQEKYKLGIIGTGRIANRFFKEVKFVNGVEAYSALNPNMYDAVSFVEQNHLFEAHSTFDEFIKTIDAVYIASPHLTHFCYIEKSLMSGKHVLCEIPMVLSAEEARYLYSLAEKQDLVLMEASKTAHCPAFNRLVALVKSGVIGEVVEVRSSISKLLFGDLREFDIEQAGGCMTELASLPLLSIVKMLGKDYKNIQFFSKIHDGVDIFTKGFVVYNNAIATFTLGLGVKTEGNLVVSGTKGYVYVPSPWWKTEYFEVRFEDQNLNKKYFYTYEGEGLRYELQEFITMIVNKRFSTYRLRRTETVSIISIIEKYRNNENLTVI